MYWGEGGATKYFHKYWRDGYTGVGSAAQINGRGNVVLAVQSFQYRLLRKQLMWFVFFTVFKINFEGTGNAVLPSYAGMWAGTRHTTHTASVPAIHPKRIKSKERIHLPFQVDIEKYNKQENVTCYLKLAIAKYRKQELHYLFPPS